jgi:hypothetical protein
MIPSFEADHTLKESLHALYKESESFKYLVHLFLELPSLLNVDTYNDHLLCNTTFKKKKIFTILLTQNKQ